MTSTPLEFDSLVFRRVPARARQRIGTVVGLVDRINDDFIEEADDFLVGRLRLEKNAFEMNDRVRKREEQRMQNGCELLVGVDSYPFRLARSRTKHVTTLSPRFCLSSFRSIENEFHFGRFQSNRGEGSP